MSDDFYPISDPVGGSVPTVDEVSSRRRSKGRRRIGLAAAALALVAGGTVGGIALGNGGSGEHPPGFSTVTSQAFAGGQEEPNDTAQPVPPPTTRDNGESGDSD
jgi:hypothetical protein